MRFIAGERFRAQFKRLPREHQQLFSECVLRKFEPACDGWAEAIDAGMPFIWPASLRVARIVGAAEIFEMTWNFSAPDGRATFELVNISGQWHCKWRRIGTHTIFRDP